MRLLIIGAPGAGKGTQSAAISAHYGIPSISTGAIFRDIVKSGTPMGEQIGALISEGNFVPDELTSQIVFERLSQPDCVNGFLLDGYPRTKPQVVALKKFLNDQGQHVDAVLYLHVPRETLIQRLTERAKIDGRTDDTAAVITKRQDIYEAETRPLLDYYRNERKYLVEVDGVGPLAEVQKRIFDSLDSFLANKK